MTIKLDFEQTEQINLQLYSDNKYWFDELGIEPIKIEKNIFSEV